VRRVLAASPEPLIETSHADFMFERRGESVRGGLAHLLPIDAATAEDLLARHSVRSGRAHGSGHGGPHRLVCRQCAGDRSAGGRMGRSTLTAGGGPVSPTQRSTPGSSPLPNEPRLSSGSWTRTRRGGPARSRFGRQAVGPRRPLHLRTRAPTQRVAGVPSDRKSPCGPQRSRGKHALRRPASSRVKRTAGAALSPPLCLGRGPPRGLAIRSVVALTAHRLFGAPLRARGPSLLARKPEFAHEALHWAIGLHWSASFR
jgi:hypothetical protein